MSLHKLKLVSNEIDTKQGLEPANFSKDYISTKSQLPALRTLTEKIEEQEQKLTEFSSAFWNLFKHSNIGFSEVGVDGYFLEVNDAWCRLAKRSREELLTLKWQDITMPEFVDDDEENVQALIDGKIPTYTMYKEYFYLNKNGERVPIPLELTVSCVYDAHKKLLYFISQAIDLEAVCKRYRLKRGCCCGEG